MTVRVSAGVASWPSSKTWASKVIEVVSEPSPLATVTGAPKPRISNGPHMPSSSRGPSVYPAGWLTDAVTRTTSPIISWPGTTAT